MPAANENKYYDKVAERSPESKAMIDAWDLVDDLNNGTDAMRAAGTRYLPKRPLEESTDYNDRLKLATLYPAFSETLLALVGRAFSDPMTVGTKLDPYLKENFIADVDLQGRNFDVFCYDWFSEAMRLGLTHCLVEAPVIDQAVTTVAEEKKANLRPYLIQVNPRRVLGWKCSQGKLTQVRIEFDDVEQDPANEFATTIVKRIRVYEEAQVRIFEKRMTQDGEKWMLAKTLPNRFGFIPLVTLYTNRTGFMTAKPPLKELAHLNAKHYILQSGNDSLVDTVQVPILAISGAPSGDDIVIGAKHAVKLPTGATMEYVEHTGAAIATGQENLRTLKDEMRQAGAKLLAPQTEAAKTATEAREDSARENSQLGAICKNTADTFNALLDMVAKTRGSESANAEIKLNPNLDPDFEPNETVKTLTTLNQQSIISRRTVFNETKRRGMLSADVDWEKEQAQLKQEQAELGLADPLAQQGGEEEEMEDELDAEGKPTGKKVPAKKKPEPAFEE